MTLTTSSEAYSKGYSSYWRKNKSITEAVELANVLRALRKVAGYVGENVGQICWEGMAEEKGGGKIIFAPSFILGEYPVPPGKVDIFAGRVIHESLHRKEWSELVWEKVEGARKGMSFPEMDVLSKMVTAGEDIYVDKISEKSVFGLYVREAREEGFEPGLRRDPLLSPTPGILFDLWRKQALDNSLPQNINPLYEQPLAILLSYTGELVDIRQGSASVTSRCSQRSELYLRIWDALKDIILPWKRDSITYFKQIPKKVEEVRRTTTTPPKEVLPHSLARRIEEELALGSKDVTPFIKQICGEDNLDVLPTVFWDSLTPSHPTWGPYLIARLKGIFQTYAERVSILNRGLKSGQIDKRRLYRAYTSGNCFMIKQLLPYMAWNIIILVDASRSMHGAKWKLVESTVASLEHVSFPACFKARSYTLSHRWPVHPQDRQ
jgi:hypothetical protein